MKRYRVFQYYGCSDESPRYFALRETEMNNPFASLLLSLHSARADGRERIEYRLFGYLLVPAKDEQEAIKKAKSILESRGGVEK